MIADIAVIISAYAVARLLNEYVFEGEKLQPLRFIVAILACGLIALMTVEVVSAANSLSGLNL